jgi:hypothetical protein
MEHTEQRKLRHDILGSLNSIKLSMEVIKTAKDRDELLMFLGFIDNEVDKVEGLVDQLVYPGEK